VRPTVDVRRERYPTVEVLEVLLLFKLVEDFHSLIRVLLLFQHLLELFDFDFLLSLFHLLHYAIP